MKKLLFLVLALVLCTAVSAQASIWSTVGDGTQYGKSAIEWSSGPIVVTAADLTKKSLEFDWNMTTYGSWDGIGNTKPDKLATLDKFTIQVYKDGNLVNTFLTNTIDQSQKTDVGSQHWKYLLPNDTGVYAIKAWSDVTARDEKWSLDSASFKESCQTAPTPLPAAVWLLGSGLVGVMGFRRVRKTGGVE